MIGWVLFLNGRWLLSSLQKALQVAIKQIFHFIE